jgi:large subunit ribosomal protein L21
MYAVIETGGKQYRVEVGTELEVELLDGADGDSVNLDRILLIADGDAAEIGQPVVANASVAAEVVRRDRGPKLINFKYGPKTRRRVKKGHRQELTVLRISDIVLNGKSAAGEKAEVDKARRAERAKLEETARKQAAADAALAAKLAADEAKSEKAAKADKTTKPDKAQAAKAAPAKAAPGKAAPAKRGSARTSTTKAKAAPAEKASKATTKASAKPATNTPKTSTKAAPKRGTTKKDS